VCFNSTLFRFVSIEYYLGLFQLNIIWVGTYFQANPKCYPFFVLICFN
ncbi:unnamed protein product, partial [Rotaria magnacalcarata]